MPLSLGRITNSMYFSSLNPVFRHINVKYLTSGFYLQRRRDSCTEVRSSKGSPLWGRRRGSKDTEGAYLQELKHLTKHLIQTPGLILLSYNVHVSLAQIRHVLRPPVPLQSHCPAIRPNLSHLVSHYCSSPTAF